MTRSINPDSVPAGGGEVTVTVRINGAYGGIGSVKETLPAGFTYVDGSVTPSDVTPERDGQEVELSTRRRDIFQLQGEHLKHGRTASVLRQPVDLWR